MWSKEILLKPWSEMFYFKWGFFLLTFMSIYSFLKECFCKTQTLLWLKLILYSEFSPFLLEKLPFFCPYPDCGREPSTAGCGPAPGSPCWHLPRALGFLWPSEQVWLFNCLCTARLLKSIPQEVYGIFLVHFFSLKLFINVVDRDVVPCFIWRYLVAWL